MRSLILRFVGEPNAFALAPLEKPILNRIFKGFVFLVAATYFMVDAAFWTLANPLARRVADHWIFDNLRKWLVSLGPYSTLALFAVPVIILEPVKPLAAYLAATGHVVGGLTILAIGEILKLVLIERLFRIGRDKLLSIRAFAWCYDKFRRAQNRVQSLEAWHLIRHWALVAKYAVRSYATTKTESNQSLAALPSSIFVWGSR